MIPGDPALLVLVGPTGEGNFTEEQYGVWMWGVVRGDLGDSIFYERPVVSQLKEAVPVTLELAVLGMLLSFFVAVPLEVWPESHWPGFALRKADVFQSDMT